MTDLLIVNESDVLKKALISLTISRNDDEDEPFLLNFRFFSFLGKTCEGRRFLFLNEYLD